MRKIFSIMLILVLTAAGLSSGSSVEAAASKMPTAGTEETTITLPPINPKIPLLLEPIPIPVPLDKTEIKFVYPLEGAVFKKGQPFIIQFQVKEPGTHLLYLSKDAGKTWTLLHNGTVEANPMGYLPLKIDDPGAYRIKVQKEADSDISAVGGSFTVTKEDWDGQVKAVTGDKKIELAWKGIVGPSKSVSSYRIYRSTPHPDAPNLLMAVSILVFEDNADSNIENNITDSLVTCTDNYVTIGQNYYYWIFPFIGGQEYNNAYPLYDMVSAVVQGTMILTVGSPYMVINGETREIETGRGGVPLIVNGRTFLPIRGLVQAMGGTIDWDTGANVLSVTYKKKIIKMQIGSTTAMVNGSPVTMDIAPYIGPAGSMMVHMRYVAEFLDCTVSFDTATQKITITYE